MVRILADSSITPCSFALTNPELFEGTGNAAEEQPPADETTIANGASLETDSRQIDFIPEATKTTGFGILSERYYSRIQAERRSSFGFLPIAAAAGLLAGCSLANPDYYPEEDVYVAAGNPISGGSILLTSSIAALFVAGVFSRLFGAKRAADKAKPAEAQPVDASVPQNSVETGRSPGIRNPARVEGYIPSKNSLYPVSAYNDTPPPTDTTDKDTTDKMDKGGTGGVHM